jgi:hypothetical protein
LEFQKLCGIFSSITVQFFFANGSLKRRLMSCVRIQARNAATEWFYRRCSCHRRLVMRLCACKFRRTCTGMCYIVMQANQYFSILVSVLVMRWMNSHSVYSLLTQNRVAYEDILSSVWATIDGVSIGNWIYWTFTDRNCQ